AGIERRDRPTSVLLLRGAGCSYLGILYRVRVTAAHHVHVFFEVPLMRTFPAAVVLLCVVTSLSAQPAKQFVAPPAGQTPPYSLAITAGGVIYVAGQLPTDDKGNLVAGDINVQTKQVFDNLRG